MFRIILIVLLIMFIRWLVTKVVRKPCPECANRVPRKAKVCYFCKHVFAKKHLAPTVRQARQGRMMNRGRAYFLAVGFIAISVSSGVWYVNRVAEAFQINHLPMSAAVFDRDFGNVIFPALRDHETRRWLDNILEVFGVDYNWHGVVPRAIYDLGGYISFDPSGRFAELIGYVLFPMDMMDFSNRQPIVELWPTKYAPPPGVYVISPEDVDAYLKSKGLPTGHMSDADYAKRYELWGWAGLRFGLYAGTIFLMVSLFCFYRFPSTTRAPATSPHLE